MGLHKEAQGIPHDLCVFPWEQWPYLAMLPCAATLGSRVLLTVVSAE